MPKRDLYDVQGDKLVRKRRACPKCGEGVFLAEHKDRHSCGKCGYTEFLNRGKKQDEPKGDATPVPEPKEGAASGPGSPAEDKVAADGPAGEKNE